MAEWKKFTGSVEQIEELSNAKHGWIIRTKDGSEHGCVGANIMLDRYIHDAEEYFICNPNPHAEMIHRWADTGQPVYWFNDDLDEWELATAPVWNPNLKYSFRPPKEKQFIEVRDFLYKTIVGKYAKVTANKALDDIAHIEMNDQFVRWLDDDWRKIEI